MDDSPIVFFANLVRFVLIATATVLVGVTVRIIQKYYIASRAAMREGDFRGLLPTHVWLIGSSYVLLIVGSAMRHILGLDSRPDAYLAINAVAYTLGALALWLILRFENRRVNVHTGHLKEHRKGDTDTGKMQMMRRRTDREPPPGT